MNCSIIISSISLIVSLISFIYNYQVNKKNLKIELKNDLYIFNKDNDKYIMYLDAEISNRSRNPINISSVHLKFNNIDIEAFYKPIPFLGDEPKIYDKVIPYEKSSQTLPCKLDSYSSTEKPIAFVYYPNFDKIIVDTPVKALLIFNTSRGKIQKYITIKFN